MGISSEAFAKASLPTVYTFEGACISACEPGRRQFVVRGVLAWALEIFNRLTCSSIMR